MGSRVKRLVVAVPQNLEGVAKFLSEIAQEQRTVEAIRAKLNQKVDQLKVEAMTNTEPHEKKIDDLIEGLFVFASANRLDLTDGGKKKTVELPTGIFGWRLTPPAVVLRNIKGVIDNLRVKGLSQFLRVKQEVDKEAMLREPELAKTVKGVKIEQHEEFIVKPTEIEVEITRR